MQQVREAISNSLDRTMLSQVVFQTQLLDEGKELIFEI